MHLRLTLLFLMLSVNLPAMDDDEVDSLAQNVDQSFKKNSVENKFECGICFNLYFKDKIPNFGCNEHLYCEQCLKKYFDSQLEQKNTTFKCPNPICKIQLEVGANFVDIITLNSITKNTKNELLNQSTNQSPIYATNLLRVAWAIFFVVSIAVVPFLVLIWRFVPTAKKCINSLEGAPPYIIVAASKFF